MPPTIQNEPLENFEPSVREETEALFSRGDDDEIVRRERATRDQFEEKITITIDGRPVTVPLAVPETDFLGNLTNLGTKLPKFELPDPPPASAWEAQFLGLSDAAAQAAREAGVIWSLSFDTIAGHLSRLSRHFDNVFGDILSTVAEVADAMSVMFTPSPCSMLMTFVLSPGDPSSMPVLMARLRCNRRRLSTRAGACVSFCLAHCHPQTRQIQFPVHRVPIKCRLWDHNRS